jgi:cysteine dioxygenase
MTPSIAEDALGAGSAATRSFDHFQSLISDLSNILGPSSGLNSEDIGVQELHLRIESYVSQEKEWSKYAFSDFSRSYTRNLVDEGNGNSNLVSFLVAIVPVIFTKSILAAYPRMDTWKRKYDP